MCRVCWFVLLAVLGLSGQTANAQAADDSKSVALVSPALHMTLVNAGVPGTVWSQRLADGMMELAAKDPSSKLQQPTRAEVSAFTQSLTGVLSGRAIDNAQIAIVARCIVDVLQASGISNYALGARLRGALTASRVDEDKVDLSVRKFIVVGEAVRGPDDLPVVPKVPKVK
jgi:hypothetical protein